MKKLCSTEIRKLIKTKKHRYLCVFVTLGYGLENIDRERAKPSKRQY